MLLNTCKVLFPRNAATRPTMIDVLGQYLYDIRLDVWDGECRLLVHAKDKKVIVLHRPFGFASDSRQEVPTWKSVRRACLMEVIKRVVHALQSDQDKSGLTIDNDAIFGGYAFEFMAHALGLNKRVSAAALRDAVSANEALRQNGLAKTTSDPKYPITENLRFKYNHPQAVGRPQNPLCIKLAIGLLSKVMDASDLGSIHDAITRNNIVLLEDRPDYDGTRWHPAYDTLRYRWIAVLNGLIPSSRLRQVIEAMFDAEKESDGNPNASGKTDDEKLEYEVDFADIIGLPWGTHFFVRSTDHEDLIPSGELGHPLFKSFTLEGLIGRVRDNRTRLDNTNAKMVTRVDIPLSIQTVQDKHGETIYTGVAGKQSFVLCCLLETVENHAETLDQQMQEIENLAVGQRFWTRFNKTVPTTTTPPSRGVDGKKYTCYNMPTWVSIRDRLKKIKHETGRMPRKVMMGNRPIKSDGGSFILMEICSIV
jgi:hypothetical protein